jgi:hypothetical protein
VPLTPDDIPVEMLSQVADGMRRRADSARASGLMHATSGRWEMAALHLESALGYAQDAALLADQLNLFAARVAAVHAGEPSDGALTLDEIEEDRSGES